MSFRWFGESDPVGLERIRQIPGVTGVVTALHEVPVGDVWSTDDLVRVRDRVEAAGLSFRVVESLPVHEDIKLGRATRDALIDRYCESLRHIGEVGVPVVCYNFMPVFDWMRTSLDRPLEDGSRTLAYDHTALAVFDSVARMGGLPGWAGQFDEGRLRELLAAYHEVDAERLWDNLAYFLERVVPAAEDAGVKLAIHPDDPPWPVLGLPRIVTGGGALERLVRLVDRPANGVTFCTGSLGALPTNDLPGMIRQLRGRIHFAHCRNVRVTGERQFHETAHPTGSGDIDMRKVLHALLEIGFDGPIRPDHGRMIWEEIGRPGYGLNDRALGAMYLIGLWEGIGGARSSARMASGAGASRLVTF